MNLIEREVIILNTAWGMIDDMVNWGMFVKSEGTEQTSRMFHTSQHRRLFAILLGDFLSQVQAFRGDPVPLGLLAPPSNARPADRTFLLHLRQVCERPQLGTDVGELNVAVERFAAWLEKEFDAPGVNLSVIEVVADLHMNRFTYIKMCGDIAKHSLPRLEANVKRLAGVLKASGHLVKEEDAYRALDDFFTWFHDDIFIYHVSEIAECLNNIRWAIFEYLRGEFFKSWHRPEDGYELLYRYRIPESCVDTIACGMYWDLMNRVRARPWMARFTIDDALKWRY